MQILHKLVSAFGDDWVSILLNILKFLGVLVSGFAGVVAATPDHPKKKSPKAHKTRIGKIAANVFSKNWAVRWAIIGLLVTFLSQFADTIKSSADAADSQTKYEKQMAVADSTLGVLKHDVDIANQSLQLMNDTVTNIGHLISPFDSIDLDIVYEIPFSEPLVTNLINHLNGIVPGTEYTITLRAADLPDNALLFQLSDGAHRCVVGHAKPLLRAAYGDERIRAQHVHHLERNLCPGSLFHFQRNN